MTNQGFSKIWIVVVIGALAAGFLVGQYWPRQKSLAPPIPPFPRVAPRLPGEHKVCVIGGCSDTVCYNKAEKPPITTCEWRPEYACFQYARCEVQEDGKCGWTKTEKFRECWER